MWIFHWLSSFFGLTVDQKPDIHREIFTLAYNSQGGFTQSEIYDMPIYLRKFYLRELIAAKKKEEEAIKAAKSKRK